MKRKNKKFIFLLIPAVIIIAGLIIWNSYNSRIIYNDPAATGNTAGNLNNGGLFCEYNDKIYFANPYDQNKLYVMNSDCTNAKKLNEDSVASLNVQGSYIYYVKNNFTRDSVGMVFRNNLFGVYRTDLNGENRIVLYEQLSGILSLTGNYIYYQHYDDSTAFNLYKIKIDGTENKKLSDIAYNPSSIYNGKIYFSNIQGNHNICTIDISTDSTSTYITGNTYLTDMEGSYIYYIDLDKDYSLVRQNTNTRTIELLSQGRCINYNLYGNKIFYQKEGDDAGIYRMNVDGSHVEKIASGNFTNIHCTSQYTFFQFFENQGILYRVPTTGAFINVEEISIQ